MLSHSRFAVLHIAICFPIVIFCIRFADVCLRILVLKNCFMIYFLGPAGPQGEAGVAGK